MIKDNYGFIAIDDVDDIMCDDTMNTEYKMFYSTEVSRTPGIKFCLRNKDLICNESCYGDDDFCETVVFLGYPEDKVKYPNAYPIFMF